MQTFLSGKEPLADTNYRTRCKTTNEHAFGGIRWQGSLDSAEQAEHLTIQVESLMERLKEKVSLDEAKVEQNYLELEELSKEIGNW